LRGAAGALFRPGACSRSGEACLEKRFGRIQIVRTVDFEERVDLARFERLEHYLFGTTASNPVADLAIAGSIDSARCDASDTGQSPKVG